jgi:hypothetical protein
MTRGLIKPPQSKKRIGGSAQFDRESNSEQPFWSRAELLCGVAVFLTALVVYSCTLAPTVTLVDSGELILAARGLGVAHPPGFPFWVMLAHLASLVPFGNVAARINFSSALFGAVACAMLSAVVAELTITPARFAKQKRIKRSTQQAKNTEESNRTSFLQFAPAVAAGLLMAFSRTLWSYATITEVYALNALLILIVLFLLIGWRRRVVASQEDASEQITIHDRWLYAAALVFGIAMGVHHVTVAFTLPAIALVVYRTQGMTLFTSRRFLYAALVSIGALLAVYAYLPFAASRSPIMNWGNPRSLQEIWWHVTGRQYRVFFSFSTAIMGAQFVEFCRMALREFGFPWLPVTLLLAFAGFVSAFKRDRTAFWFLILIVIVDLAYCLTYEIAEDKDAYYLPLFISITIAAAFGIRWLIQLAGSKGAPLWKLRLAGALAIVLTATTAFAANWPFNNRRHYFIADDYVENLFDTIAPDGLLLTQDWQVVSPMFYAQEIQQHRPDVKVVDINLLRRSWYFDYLEHSHPALIDRSREKIDPYVQLLKQWERDPRVFDRNQELTQRISIAFLEMIQSMVRNEITVGPVYITNDVLSGDKTNGYLTRWIPHAYQLVPQGLVFNLTTDQSFHDSPDPHLRTRGLADGTTRFESDDVVRLKVLPVYARMLTNRGRYLASFNQHERASRAFKQALELDPDFAAARQGLAESSVKLQVP